MIKYVKYLVPYLLKAPRRNPVKNLAGYALAYLLMGISIILLSIAAFIWLSKQYGNEVAFTAVGVVFLLAALCLLATLRPPKKSAVPTAHNLSTDPLSKYIPDAMRENPTIQKLLLQIEENPITATATAVTVGMLLSKELFEDKQ